MEHMRTNDEPAQRTGPWFTSKYLGGLLVGGFTGVLVGPLTGIAAGLAGALFGNWLRQSSDRTLTVYMPFLAAVVMVVVGAVLGVLVGLHTAAQKNGTFRVVGALAIGMTTGCLLSLGDWLVWERVLAFGGACGMTALIVENRVAEAVWSPATFADQKAKQAFGD